MKFLIEVSDTNRGIYFDMKAEPNGVLDHATDSIACHLAALFELRVKQLVKSHTLCIEGDTDRGKRTLLAPPRR